MLCKEEMKKAKIHKSEYSECDDAVPNSESSLECDIREDMKENSWQNHPKNMINKPLRVLEVCFI